MIVKTTNERISAHTTILLDKNLNRYLAATTSSAVMYLYMFELIYKTAIGAELAIHHLLAVSSIAW